MQLILIAAGSFVSALFIFFTLCGGKWYPMVEDLDPGDYPLRSIYCVGFIWSKMKPFSLKGKMRERLIGQAKLLYDPQYAEYYASVTWAQFITFIHFGLAFGLIIGAWLDSLLMLFIGVGMGAFMGYYLLSRMKEKLKTRELECTSELPEVVSTMALLVGAGMMLRNAWHMISDEKEGTIYELMRNATNDMENGMSELDAIHKFGRITNSSEVRKFTSAMAQSIERGGSELSDFLGKQAVEMWSLKKQTMLQKGEAAATKLLMPTVLLFVGIIIAVVCGAAGMLI